MYYVESSFRHCFKLLDKLSEGPFLYYVIKWAQMQKRMKIFSSHAYHHEVPENFFGPKIVRLMTGQGVKNAKIVMM